MTTALSRGQGAVGDLLLQLALGEDAGVLAVEVLAGGSGLAAGGDDRTPWSTGCS